MFGVWRDRQRRGALSPLEGGGRRRSCVACGTQGNERAAAVRDRAKPSYDEVGLRVYVSASRPQRRDTPAAARRVGVWAEKQARVVTPHKAPLSRVRRRFPRLRTRATTVASAVPAQFRKHLLNLIALSSICATPASHPRGHVVNVLTAWRADSPLVVLTPGGGRQKFIALILEEDPARTILENCTSNPSPHRPCKITRLAGPDRTRFTWATERGAPRVRGRREAVHRLEAEPCA